MDLKRFAKKAKDAIDERGGTEGLKEDVGRARQAAGTPGGIKDKALAVREALTNKPDDGDASPTAGETATSAPGPSSTDAPPPPRSS